MDDWDFLKPWIHLVPFPRPRTRLHLSRGTVANNLTNTFSLVPRNWHHVDVREVADVGIIHSSACALELLMLALRVDYRVWKIISCEAELDTFGMMRSPLYQVPRVKFEVYSFRLNARPPQVSLFEPRVALERCETVTRALYDSAKRRIHELDARSRLNGFQIPLIISIHLIESEGLVLDVVEFLKSVCIGGDIAIGSLDNDPDTNKSYRLVEIHIVNKIPFAELNVNERERYLDCFATIQSLGAFNLPFASYQGAFDPDPRVLAWMGGASDMALCSRIPNSGVGRNRKVKECEVPLRASLDAAICFLGNRLIALKFAVFHDLLPFKELLGLFRCLPRSLRHLDMKYDFTNCQLNVVGQDLELIVNGPPPVAGSPPPLESFALSMVAGNAYFMPLSVRLLGKWFPSLKSLVLEGDKPGGINCTCFATILMLFPRLEALDLSPTRLTSIDHLLAAYEHRQCKIRVLKLRLYNTDVDPLLNALADPRSRVANTLREISVGWSHRPKGDPLAAAETMLQINQTLEYCRIARSRQPTMHPWWGGALSKYHKQQFVRKLVPVCKLAVLSVPQCAALGSDVLARIFSFHHGEEFERMVFE